MYLIEWKVPKIYIVSPDGVETDPDHYLKNASEYDHILLDLKKLDRAVKKLINKKQDFFAYIKTNVLSVMDFARCNDYLKIKAEDVLYNYDHAKILLNYIYKKAKKLRAPKIISETSKASLINKYLRKLSGIITEFEQLDKYGFDNINAIKHLLAIDAIHTALLQNIAISTFNKREKIQSCFAITSFRRLTEYLELLFYQYNFKIYSSTLSKNSRVLLIMQQVLLGFFDPVDHKKNYILLCKVLNLKQHPDPFEDQYKYKFYIKF